MVKDLNKNDILIRNLLYTNKLVRNRLRILNYSFKKLNFEKNNNYIILPLNSISSSIINNLRISLKQYDFDIFQLKKGLFKLNNNNLNDLFFGHMLIIPLVIKKNELNYILKILSDILIIFLVPNFQLFILFCVFYNNNNLIVLKSLKQVNYLINFKNNNINFIISNVLLNLGNLNNLIFYHIIILLQILTFKIKNNRICLVLNN
jgi:hypothetical protein